MTERNINKGFPGDLSVNTKCYTALDVCFISANYTTFGKQRMQKAALSSVSARLVTMSFMAHSPTFAMFVSLIPNKDG